MYASHVSLFMQSATLQHAMSSFFFFMSTPPGLKLNAARCRTYLFMVTLASSVC